VPFNSNGGLEPAYDIQRECKRPALAGPGV
jgi:hypothetical protein